MPRSGPPKLVQRALADDVGHVLPRRDLLQRTPADFQLGLYLFPGIQREPVPCDIDEWQNDSWIQAPKHAHGRVLLPRARRVASKTFNSRFRAANSRLTIPRTELISERRKGFTSSRCFLKQSARNCARCAPRRSIGCRARWRTSPITDEAV